MPAIKASISHYFEPLDKNMFVAYILSKHLHKLVFQIWKHLYAQVSSYGGFHLHSTGTLKKEVNLASRKFEGSYLCDRLP